MGSRFLQDGACNGGHYNFSLWNAAGTKCALYDPVRPNWQLATPNLSPVGACLQLAVTGSHH